MTLTELRYIVTLSQEKHFGRAAEKCFVSQPTLSVAVKKLEDELGLASATHTLVHSMNSNATSTIQLLSNTWKVVSVFLMVHVQSLKAGNRKNTEIWGRPY